MGAVEVKSLRQQTTTVWKLKCTFGLCCYLIPIEDIGYAAGLSPGLTDDAEVFSPPKLRAELAGRWSAPLGVGGSGVLI